MKEVELAKYFVNYLSCYDLYFEATFQNVDIVAKHENIMMAFEVKTSLNFTVIEQAAQNRHWFHYSYICVPYSKNMSFKREICRLYGIGILAINVKGGAIWGNVYEVEKPKLNRADRKATDYLKKSLKEYNKRSIPGASGSDGTTITPFKLTIEKVVNYVNKHPDPTIKEVLENIDHHYSSFTGAKSSLYQWINKGIINEFYFEKGIVKLSIR